MPPWKIKWTFAAEAMLRSIHWLDAARVAEAVMRLAATGAGRTSLMATDPTGLWLYVDEYKVRLRLDRREGTMLVLYVFMVTER